MSEEPLRKTRRKNHRKAPETPEVKQAKAALLAEKAALEQRLHETTQNLAAADAKIKEGIVDLKRADALLHAVEQEFRTVVENTPDQIIRYDRELRRIFVNPAAKASFQATLGHVAGFLRNDGKLLATPEEIEMIQGAIRSVLESGKPREFELTWPNVSGRRAFSVRMEPEFDLTGAVTSVLGVARDITDLKAAEEALRQSQAELARVARVNLVGALAASLAHELNQPLTGVISNAEAALRWLEAGPPNIGEASQSLQRIVRDGHRAGDVVTRTRSFLKKGEPAKAGFKVEELIRETFTLVQDETRRRHVDVQARIAPDLPVVLGDRVQVQQVLLNLLMNSFDAVSEIAGGTRQVIVRVKMKSTKILQLSIEDSGPGIGPELPERLFEAFYSTKSHGLGMGLSISRSIVEAHGGRIWAEPAKRGAKFNFTLPIDGRSRP
ncbi:MAG: sensor signal transduction histidine kinase protein [Verrucomicrobia bacterium]|nr:sensor signal transduction histidine kinase protein [Verrucomicrobiota bacterium]